MLDRGVYFAPSAYEAGFVSAAHDDATIDATIGGRARRVRRRSPDAGRKPDADHRSESVHRRQPAPTGRTIIADRAPIAARRRRLLAEGRVPCGLSLRFLIPLIAALALLAYIVVPQVDALTVRWFVRDLDSRRAARGRAARRPAGRADPAAGQCAHHDAAQQRHAERAPVRDRVLRRRAQRIAYRSANLPATIGCTAGNRRAAARHRDGGRGRVDRRRCRRARVHVARIPIHDAGRRRSASLVMVSDMSFIESRSEDTRKYTIILFLILARGHVARHGADRAPVVARMDRRRRARCCAAKA